MHNLMFNGLIQVGVLQDLTVLACYLSGKTLNGAVGHLSTQKYFVA